MNISEFIKKNNCRVECNGAWIVFSDGHWFVYQHKKYYRHVIEVEKTMDEEIAVAALNKILSESRSEN